MSASDDAKDPIDVNNDVNDIADANHLTDVKVLLAMLMMSLMLII